MSAIKMLQYGYLLLIKQKSIDVFNDSFYLRK